MPANENNRETGARKFLAKTEADASEEFSQEAAKNKKPAKGMGLAEPLNDVNEKTRHSDGRNPTSNLATRAPSDKGQEYGPQHSRPDRTGLGGRN
jgi:hypothetical protein